jgi:aldehyde dehydrogenase family 7 member A1
LKKAYASILQRLGDPLDDGTLYGPMHSKVGIQGYLKTLNEVKQLGGKIEFGGNVIESDGNFVEPTIVTGLSHDAPGVKSFFSVGSKKLTLTRLYMICIVACILKDVLTQ